MGLAAATVDVVLLNYYRRQKWLIHALPGAGCTRPRGVSYDAGATPGCCQRTQSRNLAEGLPIVARPIPSRFNAPVLTTTPRNHRATFFSRGVVSGRSSIIFQGALS